MRLIRLLGLTLVVVVSLPSATFAPPRRSEISGVALVRLHVTNLDASRKFYADTLGLPQGSQGCFSPIGAATCFFISLSQQIELVSGDAAQPINAVQALGFQVADAAELRQYLLSRGVECGKVAVSNSGDHYIEMRDPEGHRLLFLSSPGKAGDLPLSPVSRRLIHSGFVVSDRAAEDKFYKDILGFHVYWHGGRTDDETSWVDMQVPDGTDWIEYMLNVSPTASHKTLGVMNHIALGVPDIHAAQAQLIKNGWKGTEEPKIGRDGKWQLNLYDPDETRVELMEFKPTKEPCCSPYTGPHPGPPQ
jgi:catechol 2,3-dioxygenase-like lactoylglutathione lyase family enzyme